MAVATLNLLSTAARCTRFNQMKEPGRKQIPLRLSEALWKELAAWAEDDFRSLNGQIEYLLNECVRKRKSRDRGLESGIDQAPDKNCL